MSKGKGGNFSNRAARKFKEMAKVDTLSQQEIFAIFDEDMKTILDQVTAYREHQRGAGYPAYVANAFANLSTTLYFSEYVDEHVHVNKKGRIRTDLEDADLESLRQIMADAYKKSSTGFYGSQVQEFQDRNKLLSKAFRKLCPKIYNGTKKFGLSKSQRRDLTIQIYGDPVYNMRFIHRIINESVLSNKKKLKQLRKLYGKKRFVAAVGAAMCVESNTSELIGTLFEFMMGMKKRRRAPYVRAYAEAYKRVKTRYFRIDQNFYDANKPIIKELIHLDIGYKKAFKSIKDKKKKHDDRKGEKSKKPFGGK